VVVAVVIYKGYATALCSLKHANALPKSLKTAVVSVITFLVMAPLIVIGIRGGLDESTTNIGQVYYSQNQFLNHSAVNPVFSFLASLEKTASNNESYNYMSDEECQQIINKLYNTESVDSDTLLNTPTPNIIVILMESLGGEFTELSGRKDITPNLNKLAAQGVYFTNCYANSWRTDRGTVCTYSGYPSFPTSSVMKMPDKTRHLPNIALTLGKAGYETSYFYGGDINFTNMRSYLVAGGFARLTWKKDFSADEQQTSKWGVRDDIMFKAVADSLLRPHSRPQLIGFSTLSSHEPWDVPLKRLDDPIKNSFSYLDDCIRQFVERLRQSPQWHRTLVVLLPDHSLDYNGINEMSPVRNIIPTVWVGGAVKSPRDVTTVCNQTDLAATLLAQLSLPHDDFLWSRDVMSPDYRYPIAVHNFNNGFTMVDSTGFMVYDLNVRRMVAGNSPDSLRLQQIGKAVLQATTKDLKEK
jgi:phosphoglycerol transferase MdoB-like AlkP superfamily enzyme